MFFGLLARGYRGSLAPLEFTRRWHLRVTVTFTGIVVHGHRQLVTVTVTVTFTVIYATGQGVEGRMLLSIQSVCGERSPSKSSSLMRSF